MSKLKVSLLDANSPLLFQVRPVAEDEMFRVIRSGKRKSMYPIQFAL